MDNLTYLQTQIKTEIKTENIFEDESENIIIEPDILIKTELFSEDKSEIYKQCYTCQSKKLLTDFVTNQPYCKKCHNFRIKNYYKRIQNVQLICECGKNCLKRNISLHRKSKTHTNRIEILNFYNNIKSYLFHIPDNENLLYYSKTFIFLNYHSQHKLGLIILIYKQQDKNLIQYLLSEYNQYHKLQKQLNNIKNRIIGNYLIFKSQDSYCVENILSNQIIIH